MAIAKNFEDLECWKLARTTCTEIYKLTLIEPFQKDYDLRSQIRRSAISVMSNIAEGFDRQSPLQRSYFLRIAIGSAGETRSHLFLATDLGYSTESARKKIDNDLKTIIKQINSFIRNSN
jgi:four helix bundle protein